MMRPELRRAIEGLTSATERLTGTLDRIETTLGDLSGRVEALEAETAELRRLIETR